MSNVSNAKLLADLDRGFRSVLGRSRAVTGALTHAKARTSDLARSFGAEAGRGRLVETFLADALAGLALEREWSDDELAALLAVCARVPGGTPELSETAVFLQAVRDPRLLALPPRLAAEATLRLLLLPRAVAEASLWLWHPSEPFEALVQIGAPRPPRNARTAARRAIFGGAPRPERQRGLVHAVPILRWQQPVAAIVIRARTGEGATALVLAREAAAALSPVLERELLLRRSSESEKLMTEAAERRLQRIGLDLHDGPLQGIAMLLGDLRLFRGQVEEAISDEHLRRLLAGRVDDSLARLGNVDATLREMAGSFEDPAFAKQPLASAIRALLKSFCAEVDIELDFTVEGDLDGLTPSQRIAIYRIVQESLSNIREHSRATEVTVSLVRRRHSIRAEIIDDGVGFEVDRVVFDAAKRGRLGLIGMSERARLLGGTLGVESRPGGPTKVSVTLPEWKPADSSSSAAGVSLTDDTHLSVSVAPADLR